MRLKKNHTLSFLILNLLFVLSINPEPLAGVPLAWASDEEKPLQVILGSANAVPLAKEIVRTQAYHRCCRFFFCFMFDGYHYFMPIEGGAQGKLSPVRHPVPELEALCGLVNSARNIKSGSVFILLDLLDWGSALHKTHPEYFELNESLTSPVCPDGRFVTIFHPHVRAKVANLLSSLAKHYPGFDGIAIRVRYSTSQFLAYSNCSRKAYILHTGIDPVDIDINAAEGKSRSITRQYIDWRTEKMTDFVREMKAQYSAGLSRRKLLGVGCGSSYIWSSTKRGYTAADWLTWLSKGYVDEMLLEDRWSIGRATEGFKVACLLTQQKGLEPSKVLHPVIQPRWGEEHIGIAPQIQALRSQPFDFKPIYYIGSEEDWREVESFLKADKSRQ